MHIRILSCLMAALLFANMNATAQDDDNKKKKSLVISNEGISINTEDEKEKEFGIEWAVVDIGINSLQDKTNYASAEAQNFLQVPQEYQNENLFNLRTGKSINVNVWPVIARWRMLNTGGQKIYLGMGIGLQMYNFRFTRPVNYINDVTPAVVMDSISFKKNKLGMTFLSMPLMLTFKTKAGEKTSFVYGVGITGGYRIASWMKQVSDSRGKQKYHDKYNLSDFNSCLTAELGLDGYFRLYASYQITPLHENALDQYPFCLGIRIGGI